MKRRFPIDWRMVLGFGGLLSLVAAIGLIGVRQIEMLNSTVTHLARVDIPLQNAVQEMKSSNNKYAIGIRSYIFWKSARYLDAAAVAKTDIAKEATQSFGRNIAFYASMSTTAEQRDWVSTARDINCRSLSLSSSCSENGRKVISVMHATSTAVLILLYRIYFQAMYKLSII